MNQQKQNGNVIAIIAMCFLFAMISFVTNLAAPFGTIWKMQYVSAGMMGNLMNFAAYLFMGIPAGKMLVRFGYKKTALTAMAVGVIGLFVQYLSSIMGATTETGITLSDQPLMLNFVIYLLGALICGFCVCMLNTVVNPMLNMLGGGGNKGNQLIQTGGALNSFSGMLTPLLVGALIGTVSKETSMTDVSPLLFIAMGIFVLSFLVILFVQIPEPHLQKGGAAAKVKDAHSPLSFRHCVLGIVGIFLYVGIEIGIPAQIIFYMSDTTEKGAGIAVNGAAIGGAIAACYWFLMLIGRLISTAISSQVSSRAQLIFASTLAIVLTAIAIFLPKSVTMGVPSFIAAADTQMPVNVLFLVLCGLCTSVMWGGIFNLAVEGLGKYTAKASGLFMTMVVGGGVMPVIQESIANAAGYMNSYWLVIAMFAYLLYYGLIGCKNVNKDIPVE